MIHKILIVKLFETKKFILFKDYNKIIPFVATCDSNVDIKNNEKI